MFVIVYVCMTGIACVRLLVGERLFVDTNQCWQMAPAQIHMACKSGDIDWLSAHLSSSTSIGKDGRGVDLGRNGDELADRANLLDKNSYSPLHYSACFGHLACVEKLIQVCMYLK